MRQIRFRCDLCISSTSQYAELEQTIVVWDIVCMTCTLVSSYRQQEVGGSSSRRWSAKGRLILAAAVSHRKEVAGGLQDTLQRMVLSLQGCTHVRPQHHVCQSKGHHVKVKSGGASQPTTSSPTPRAPGRHGTKHTPSQTTQADELVEGSPGVAASSHVRTSIPPCTDTTQQRSAANEYRSQQEHQGTGCGGDTGTLQAGVPACTRASS